MADKKSDKRKRSHPGKAFTREMARARYENFREDQIKESDEEFVDPVEIKIRQAMSEGVFDNLPGKGKPLDLDKYQKVPEQMRTAYHVIKNAGYIPEEVRLKKEMETLKDDIRRCQSKAEKDRLMKELAEVSQQFYFYMEYNKQLK
jgi:hypothetical protein